MGEWRIIETLGLERRPRPVNDELDDALNRVGLHGGS
jgi:hypothetical protein